MVFHIPYIRYDNYVSTVLETFLNILLLIPMPEVQKKRQKKALIIKQIFHYFTPLSRAGHVVGKFIVPSGKSIFGYFECLFVPPIKGNRISLFNSS